MNDKLWSKGLPLNEMVQVFTTDDDPSIDLHLLAHDCVASAAHVHGLFASQLISFEQAETLLTGLKEAYHKAIEGSLPIEFEQEDGHTALEAFLTQRDAESGKNVHLGRSRNDQVATAMRLWLRKSLIESGLGLNSLAASIRKFSDQHGHHAMPGYTHLRRAMPSSVGQWCTAWLAGIAEEMTAMLAVLDRLDRCPLGSAAGFGTPLPLNRELTANLLGFSRVQKSPIDVQNSRGRHEAAVLRTLNSVSMVLERLVNDLLILTTEEFGFFKVPDAFTTGSSIMPQKRNPDVIELSRGRLREFRNAATTVESIATGLTSSYHRDHQLLKRNTIPPISRFNQVVNVLQLVFDELTVDADRLKDACSPELYAAEIANQRTQELGSFRDAYRAVAAEILAGTFQLPDGFDPAQSAVDWKSDAEEYEKEIRAATEELSRLNQKFAAIEQTIWNLTP